MKVTAEKIDNHKMMLEMEIPETEVAKAVDKAYHKLANRVSIPGFRPGKAPRRILEMRIGKAALLDEAFDIIAPKAFTDAIAEQHIDPVSKPEIDVVTLEEGKPLVFKATVVVKPEVALGEYSGLEVETASANVGDEEVERYLDHLRDRHAEMVVVDDGVLANGDFAIIDFEGFVDEKPFEGGTAKGYPLEIGSGSFIPGFEEQLIGARAGEQREIKVPFPADYHVTELAGKESLFKVKVNDVKRKKLPELDVDFVKEASEFNTVEELKADAKNKLEKAATQAAEREFRQQAVQAAVGNAQTDIPDVMTEERIDRMIENFDISLQNRGSNLAKFLEYTKTDLTGLRARYRESAANDVKTDLVLEAVAKQENMQVSNEEMDAEVAAMAASYNAPVENVRKIIVEDGRVDALAKSVLRKKAAQWIIDHSVRKEKQSGQKPEEADAAEVSDQK